VPVLEGRAGWRWGTGSLGSLGVVSVVCVVAGAGV